MPPESSLTPFVCCVFCHVFFGLIRVVIVHLSPFPGVEHIPGICPYYTRPGQADSKRPDG